MDEKEILLQLNNMLATLEKIGENIANNDWNSVQKKLTAITAIENRIKENPTPITTLLAQNASFNTQYSTIKEKLLQQLEQTTTTIDAWKTDMMEKISSSKNTLGNISRLYQSQNKTSYYFDRKE